MSPSFRLDGNVTRGEPWRTSAKQGREEVRLISPSSL
jgi:hypothetical protein